ncbi:MAG: DUF1292 domain-containing protein [Clostridia bacterium]|nr:DUF1292 domain-containing protein [Clostridia bacterium]
MSEKEMNVGNEENICYLEDETGKEHKFEVIADIEQDGVMYYAMIPAEESEMDGEFCEYVILKEVEENGEMSLVEIEDDAEFNKIADIFDKLFDEEIDYDATSEKK